MVTLLSKLWIKSDNYKDSKVREKYGVLCGAVGIFLNVLLVPGKILCWITFGGVSRSRRMRSTIYQMQEARLYL